jgi:hypothetical protein
MPIPRKLMLCCALLALTSAVLPGTSFAGPKQLIDSNDYKDKDFKKCAIADYADMAEGDDVDWLWADPALKLAEYKLKVGKVDNKSEIHSRSMVEAVKNTFKDTFADLETKGAAGTLTADLCIYEAENMNTAKAWIPFVGGHQMQAGIGIEMVLRDEHDKPVAKFRHFAREGGQIEAAAQEVVGDLMKYIDKH